MRDGDGDGDGEGADEVDRVPVEEVPLLLVLLLVLREREDCLAARAASSSRRLHCRQVKPSLVSHAVGTHTYTHGSMVQHTARGMCLSVVVVQRLQ